MYQVVKFNNHWCVRDKNNDRQSNWYRNKSEAYTAKVDLQQQDQEQGDLFVEENLPDTYQVLVKGEARYRKFQKGKWTTKKSAGPYKNIEIVSVERVQAEIPFN